MCFHGSNRFHHRNKRKNRQGPQGIGPESRQKAGLSLSTLVGAYLRQVVATRRIELFAPEEMTPDLESLIAEVENELRLGQASPTFDSVDTFLADLKK